MSERRYPGQDPYRFIHENLDSVPHLESLILLWNSRPVGWTEEELASRLYIPPEQVRQVLRDLSRLQIVQEIAGPPPRYSYLSRSEEQENMMRAVDDAYRRDLVRISTMIHSKASSPVREFARAFRFKKDRDQ
jgi:predicted ArsR family transcriptional regulator